MSLIKLILRLLGNRRRQKRTTYHWEVVEYDWKRLDEDLYVAEPVGPSRMSPLSRLIRKAGGGLPPGFEESISRTKTSDTGPRN